MIFNQMEVILQKIIQKLCINVLYFKLLHWKHTSQEKTNMHMFITYLSTDFNHNIFWFKGKLLVEPALALITEKERIKYITWMYMDIYVRKLVYSALKWINYHKHISIMIKFHKTENTSIIKSFNTGKDHKNPFPIPKYWCTCIWNIILSFSLTSLTYKFNEIFTGKFNPVFC